MKTFQCYQANVPEDEEAIWINAPSAEVVRKFIAAKGWRMQSDAVDEIGPYTLEQGVDFVLDEHANIIGLGTP